MTIGGHIGVLLAKAKRLRRRGRSLAYADELEAEAVVWLLARADDPPQYKKPWVRGIDAKVRVRRGKVVPRRPPRKKTKVETRPWWLMPKVRCWYFSHWMKQQRKAHERWDFEQWALFMVQEEEHEAA